MAENTYLQVIRVWAAMAWALSICSRGVTHTGHPGPCTSSIGAGSIRSSPCFTME